jgi:hypothetical protein
MANKLEAIAEKKKKLALAKQEEDIARFAKKVAEEVVGKLDSNKTEEIQSTVAELATSVAQTVIASNKTFDAELKDSFTQLLSAVKQNKPDNSSLVKLNKEIGRSLAKFELALDAMEFNPEIIVPGLSEEQLKKEVDKILAKLPATSKREVTIAYEKATADKYINVRLTDGIKFYSAFSSGGGGGGREGGATEAKQEEIITAIGNIGDSTNYTTRIETVGTLTYIGNAAIGSATSSNVWQIKRLETPGLTKLWADGNDSFDNIWDNYASLSYS